MVRKRDSPQHDSLDDGGLRARLELVGEPALAAVLAVLVEGHLHNGYKQPYSDESRRDTYEDTSTALGRGALATEPLDLAVRVDLVVLEDRHLDLLALVLDLLGGLLGCYEKSEHVIFSLVIIGF